MRLEFAIYCDKRFI